MPPTDLTDAGSQAPPAPRVRVVVLNYDGGEHVLRCVDALTKTTWPADALEIVLVDNASRDGSASAVKAAHPSVTLVPAGANLRPRSRS